jgi:hypothetical protein
VAGRDSAGDRRQHRAPTTPCRAPAPGRSVEGDPESLPTPETCRVWW